MMMMLSLASEYNQFRSLSEIFPLPSFESPTKDFLFTIFSTHLCSSPTKYSPSMLFFSRLCMFMALVDFGVSFLWRWILDHGLEISPGSCRNAVDVDGDGQITKEEFVEKGFLINSSFICFTICRYIYIFNHWAVNILTTRKSKYMDLSKQANRHKYFTDECRRLKIKNN